MTTLTQVQQMREAFKPRGTAPLVQLHVPGYGFYDADFIDKCLDDLERMPAMAAVGQMPSNLEKLAYDILKHSAGMS